MLFGTRRFTQQGGLPQRAGTLNGFIKGRQGSHNICRLMNIIHVKKETSDMAMVGLDAEKVFDRVEHEYLFEVLNLFGIVIFSSGLKSYIMTQQLQY